MILASASPRRQELLTKTGFKLSVAPADIDESRHKGESPVALVERLSREKALASLNSCSHVEPHEIVLAADTVVWIENDIFGKPQHVAEAHAMLRRLSGAEHNVSTGVCLIVDAGCEKPIIRTFSETTRVRFFELSDAEIAAYVATGEPMDKAGAYGIQDRARQFVRGIEGDYCNVVGLPVARVVRELAKLSPTLAQLPEQLMAGTDER